MVKSSYFQDFHFCFSVLQAHNRNQYGSCLPDHLNFCLVKLRILGNDFGSKFGHDLVKKWENVAVFRISTSVF